MNSSLLRTLLKTVAAATVLATTLAAQAGDVVVVMAPGAAALSKDQVANLYLGRANDLKVLDLPDGNPVRESFYKKATDRDSAQIKAVWSRVVFTGKGQPPKEMPDAAAVKKAVAADPKVVGYIEKSAADASVKVVLELD